MAINYRIDKATYDKLPEAVKTEYDADGDGYKLDLVGIDLKAQDKLDGERSKRRAAETAKKAAEDKLSELQDSDDRPQLIDKHARDMAKEKKRADDAEAKFTNYVTTTTKDTAAKALSNKLSKVHGDLLLPHVAARLNVDMTDPMAPKVVVLDANGAATTKTTDDLYKELFADKRFSGIVTASQASGGTPGNDPRGTGQRGIPGGQGINPPPRSPAGNTGGRLLSDMSPAELAGEMRERRAARELAGNQ